MRAGLYSRNAEVKAMFKEFHQSYSCWQKKLCTRAKRNTWAGHLPQAGVGHKEGWGARPWLGFAKGINPHWLLDMDFPMFKMLVTEKWSTKIYLQGLFSKKNNFFLHFRVTRSQQLRGCNQDIAGGFHSGPRASTDQSSSFVNCSYGG